MDLKGHIKRAVTIKNKYALVEIKTSGKPWSVLERTQGFMGDAGDLMKLVMAKNNLRNIDNVDEKLKHELSDCLWSILVIADELGIDMDEEFTKSMDDLEKKILVIK
ncbi:MAG: nucleotide pyrophosphohydrolase [Patescibacteria group bacterium]